MLMSKNIILVVVFSLLAGCSSGYNAVYQRVDAQSKWDETGRMVVNDAGDKLPLFTVKDNKLYLMIQSEHVEWIFRSVITYPSWDKAELSRLLEQHPEIQPLMPVDWNNWLPKGYGDECKGKGE